MGWFDERFFEDKRRVHVACTVCFRSYWLPKSKANLYVTCGGECAKKRREQQQFARERACATCGTAFIPRATQLAGGKGRFCSQACNSAVRAACTPEVRRKAADTWVKNNRLFGYVPVGPANSRWTGGPKATYERRLASGLLREQNHKRRVRGGKPIKQGAAMLLGGRQKWRCAACEIDLKVSGYHIDHIMPLALGGTNEMHNLQLLCIKCNRRKHAKHPVDFMQSIGKLL